jgi:hypothetical protein
MFTRTAFWPFGFRGMPMRNPYTQIAPTVNSKNFLPL